MLAFGPLKIVKTKTCETQFTVTPVYVPDTK